MLYKIKSHIYSPYAYLISFFCMGSSIIYRYQNSILDKKLNPKWQHNFPRDTKKREGVSGCLPRTAVHHRTTAWEEPAEPRRKSTGPRQPSTYCICEEGAHESGSQESHWEQQVAGWPREHRHAQGHERNSTGPDSWYRAGWGREQIQVTASRAGHLWLVGVGDTLGTLESRSHCTQQDGQWGEGQREKKKC